MSISLINLFSHDGCRHAESFLVYEPSRDLAACSGCLFIMPIIARACTSPKLSDILEEERCGLVLSSFSKLPLPFGTQHAMVCSDCDCEG